MKKALIKDTFREIKNSFGRFISIFGIVLVGVFLYRRKIVGTIYEILGGYIL